MQALKEELIQIISERFLESKNELLTSFKTYFREHFIIYLFILQFVQFVTHSTQLSIFPLFSSFLCHLIIPLRSVLPTLISAPTIPPIFPFPLVYNA